MSSWVSSCFRSCARTIFDYIYSSAPVPSLDEEDDFSNQTPDSPDQTPNYPVQSLSAKIFLENFSIPEETDAEVEAEARLQVGTERAPILTDEEKKALLRRSIKPLETTLSVLIPEATVIKTIQTAGPYLYRLRIHPYYKVSHILSEITPERHPNLQSLYIPYAARPKPADQHLYAWTKERWPNLKDLRLNCTPYSKAQLTQVAHACPALQVLRLEKCCSPLTDKVMKVFSQNCPDLRWVIFSESGNAPFKFTEKGLRSLLQNCHQLQRIDIHPFRDKKMHLNELRKEFPTVTIIDPHTPLKARQQAPQPKIQILEE